MPEVGCIGKPACWRAAVARRQFEVCMKRVHFPFETPFINTIHVSRQPAYPGDEVIERRIKSLIRWNAMAMVVRANKNEDGIGGHISTYASAATLYEVAFNHFFKGQQHPDGPDHVYFQGHASPGIYARAFLEGRLSEEQLFNFRRELASGGGLPSYPHPWLMRDFWEFPTVSMGLGPMQAIYQARFNRYLHNRGFKDTSKQRVWAFLGDGECDEPESLGALTVASREKLDNLTFVINCNLQRLDGPVRGNGKIIQELESAYRGAGWNVIKVIWGRDWDPLLAQDDQGFLMQRMHDVVDGELQKYVVEPGSYTREHFFGKCPETLKMVEHYSDERIQRLGRGGHDAQKVHAAFAEAVATKGRPSVVLCHTIKGYGMGEAGEGRNVTHQQKKLNEEEMMCFRDRFDISLSDDQVKEMPFFHPGKDSEECKYLIEKREALGGFVPSRNQKKTQIQSFSLDEYKEFTEGTAKGREVSTTMAFVSFLSKLLKHETLGSRIVPIIPDEARTFGMHPLFKQVGIYSSVGQLYEPVDRSMLLYYKEATSGQLLEEGITEAGAICSFISSATSDYTNGVPTIPMYIYYSMFGFQRVGDFIWALQDMCGRGFLLGATAGRTTLSGEGLQHQDGHSLLLASTYPRVRSYEPAFAYEILTLVQDGMKRMYQDGEEVVYYITLQNENYEMPKMPEGVTEGITKGLYKYKASSSGKARVHLLGSGSIILHALRAQEILQEKFKIEADVWSATSYSELRREALDCERWNMLHPQESKKVSWLETQLGNLQAPVVAVSDWMKAVPDQIARWVPAFTSLGTDGLGRSASRQELRRHFEIDAECIVVASLWQLCKQGDISCEEVAVAIKELGVDAEKLNPVWT